MCSPDIKTFVSKIVKVCLHLVLVGVSSPSTHDHCNPRGQNSFQNSLCCSLRFSGVEQLIEYGEETLRSSRGRSRNHSVTSYVFKNEQERTDGIFILNRDGLILFSVHEEYCFNPESPLLQESILKLEERAWSCSTARHDYLVVISSAFTAAEKAAHEHTAI